MLDGTEEVAIEAEIEATEEAEAEAPAQTEEAAPEEVVIGFEGDEAPELEPETPLIKQLRAKLKDEAKRVREATARLAEYEAAKPKPPAEEKPTIASCGYDDSVYEQKLAAWYDGKAERDAAEKQKAKAEEDRQAEWNTQYQGYEEQKTTLKVPDFSEAEDVVRSALSREQQAIIVRNIAKPAAFVYALGKNEAKVKELAGMKDLDKFTAAVVRLEGKVTVTERKAPPPETKLPGTSASAGGSIGSRLEAAEKRAELTGDRTEILRIRREMQSAGQKV